MSFITGAVQHRVRNLLLTESASDYAQVFNRADVSGFDSIDWAILGIDGSSNASPFLGTTALAHLILVSNTTPDNILAALEGASWHGNFSVADRLARTVTGNNGALQIDFSESLSAFGAQIETRSFGPFVGKIQVYDTALTLQATFYRSGVSANNADGSAIFLGARNKVAANIGRVIFSVVSAETFGINTVSLATLP